MTATIKLRPSDHTFSVEADETLLEGALRSGLNVNYHCSNGSCGDCKAKLISGNLGSIAHHDYVINAGEKAQGCFLMCRAVADSDLVVETNEANSVDDIPEQELTAQVSRLELPIPDVAVVQLRTPRSQTLRFLAGQHMTVQFDGLEPRNKSLASCPCNGMVLQFHVRRIEGDPFSEYVFSTLKNRTKVQVKGPYGQFILDEQSSRPIVFIAYETGFSPIKSLIEHAISLDIPQSVRFYWVVRDGKQHYQENFCRSWQDALDDFHYSPLVAEALVDTADAGDIALQTAQHSMLQAVLQLTADIPDLQDYDVYMNGPDEILESARKRLLAHGLPAPRLFVDHLRRF